MRTRRASRVTLAPTTGGVGIVVALAFALWPQPARAEFCGAMGLSPQVVTDADLVIPGDGGVLVAAMPGVSDAATDVADQPGWRFRSGTVASMPRRVTLAPGLVAYHARQDGSLTLVDADGTQRAAAFATHRPRPRLPAPRVVFSVRTPERAEVAVQLATEPPPDAVALVLVGKDGTARSWDFVAPDSTRQRAFRQRGCAIQPAGTLPSSAGDEVRFQFVDVWGRLSAPSALVTIRATPPAEPHLERP